MLKATKGSSRMDNPETLPTLGNQDTGHGETKTHNTTQIKKEQYGRYQNSRGGSSCF